MSSDTEILEKLIRKEARVPVDGNSVTLREPQNNRSVVKIQELPDDAVIIRADMFPAPLKIFNNEKGVCKRADFILISESEKKVICLEMEMRKKNKTEAHVISQLMGAECCMKYCQEIGKKFWRQDNFLEEYDCSYVSIRVHPMEKASICNHKKESSHGVPESFQRIICLAHDELCFKEIAA